VIYDNASGRSRWASNTSNRGYILAFQADNNIVIYDSNGRGVWDSGTMGYCGYNGQPGDSGATLYIANSGDLALVGDGTQITMGYNQTSGGHFGQNYVYN